MTIPDSVFKRLEDAATTDADKQRLCLSGIKKLLDIYYKKTYGKYRSRNKEILVRDDCEAMLYYCSHLVNVTDGRKMINVLAECSYDVDPDNQQPPTL